MRIIYTFSLLLAATALFLGNSGGAGAVQNQDRTGGPLANQFCGLCHGAGAFNPSLQVEAFFQGAATTTYTPGETYTIRLTISDNGGASGYGFQAVALDDNDAGIGTLTADTGQQTVTIGGVDYVEHSQTGSSNVFEFNWEAPASGNGDANFYAAITAVNNNGGSGGDGAAFLQVPLVLSDMTVNTNDIPELATELTAFPNPAVDVLQVKLAVDRSTNAQLRLVNTLGQTLLQQREQLNVGANQLSLDVASLPAGNYVLELSDETSASRTMIVKR